MKKFLSIIIIIILISSMVLSVGAQSYDFQSAGVNSVYSAMNDSYTTVLESSNSAYKSPYQLSGVYSPYSESYTMVLRFVLRIYEDNLDTITKEYIERVSASIDTSYGSEAAYIQIGDKDLQNGFTYDRIKVYSYTNSAQTEASRGSFLSSPFDKDLMVKTAYNTTKRQYTYGIELYFNMDEFSFPLSYDCLSGEVKPNQSDIVAIDPNHFIYPRVYFPYLYQEYLNAGYDIDGSYRQAFCYLRLAEVDIYYSQGLNVQPILDRTYLPTYGIYTNFYAPFHNSVIYRQDTRYNFTERFTTTSNVTIGSSNAKSEGIISSTMLTNSPSYEKPFVNFRYIQKKVDTIFYYVGLNSKDGATYTVRDTNYHFEHSLDNGAYPNFIRTTLYSSTDYKVQGTDWTVYPISFGAFTAYKHSSNIMNYIGHGNEKLNGINYGQFYVDIAPQGENVWDKIANIFTQTIPNILYNALVWIMCESPLLSKITGPIFALAVTAGDFVTMAVLPVLSAAGILGIFFVTKLIIDIIRRLLLN